MKRPPAETPKPYGQDGKGYEAIVYAHYFVGSCDWFVTEYDPKDDIAFGWACLGDRNNAELGYVSLTEMEQVRIPPYGLLVDYEDDWQQTTLAYAIARMDAKQGRM
jgi:hypothetical protein